MIFIDSKTRYLFCADACNRNLLLMQSGDHTEGRYVSVEKAAKAMERIVSMKEQYDHVINSHNEMCIRDRGKTSGKNEVNDLQKADRHKNDSFLCR